MIPVYKKRSQTSLSNYRPISLLSIFFINYLRDLCTYNRLVSFLDKHHVLFEKQFGFRFKHAILSIVDKIQKAIEERNYSGGIFLDFSKAFDTVNHKVLLGKLEPFGPISRCFLNHISARSGVLILKNHLHRLLT